MEQEVSVQEVTEDFKEVIYYSPSNRGFYFLSGKKGYEQSAEGWPEDALAITQKQYDELFAGQDLGAEIVPDGAGYPTLKFPEENWQGVADTRRNNLVQEVMPVIQLWQTELQLGMIEDDDKEKLIMWIKYMKALKAMNFYGIDTKQEFEAIVWPTHP